MSALTREPSHVDAVVRNTGLAAAQVSATLALLELKGLVRNVGGMQYGRVREETASYEPGIEASATSAPPVTESETR